MRPTLLSRKFSRTAQARMKALTGLLAFFALYQGAEAQITRFTWTGATSSNFTVGSNWSGGTAPSSSNNFILDASGINRDLDLTTASFNISGAYLYGGNYSLSSSNAQTVTWGTGQTIKTSGPIQLGSGSFTVNTNLTTTGDYGFGLYGTGSGDLFFNGTIANGAQAAPLMKYNTSNVTFTNTFTSNSSGTQEIRVGALILSGSGAMSLGNSGSVVQIGGQSKFGFRSNAGGFGIAADSSNAALILDNTVTNLTNRVTDANKVQFLQRGLLEFRGNDSAASSETFGILNLAQTSANGLIRVLAGDGQSARLTFSSLQVNNGANTGNTPGSLEFLVANGQTLGASGAAGSRVIFTTDPTLSNGVIRYGIVKDESVGGGANFATYNSTVDDGVELGVQSLASFTTTDINSSTATANVDLSGSATLTGAKSFNTLRINATGAGQSLALGSNNLSPNNARGFIYNGNGYDYTISGTGSFIANGGTYIYINSDTLTVSANFTGGIGSKSGEGLLKITGNYSSGGALAVDKGAVGAYDMEIAGALTGATAINKSGVGVLALTGSGNNTAFSAGITLTAGTLVLAKETDALQSSALGTGTLTFAGGALAAAGRAATISNNVSLTNGVGLANQIVGDQAITITGTVKGNQVGGNNYVFVNDATADVTLAGTVQGAASACGTATMTGLIEFAGSGRTIISGVLQNADGGDDHTEIYKMGTGTLVLSNASNSYTGPTRIHGGTLRVENSGALGSGSVVIGTAASSVYVNTGQLANAVLELADGMSFTRNLSATVGSGNVTLGMTDADMVNNAGFAATSGTASVNLGNQVTPSTLTWENGGFFSNTNRSGALILGSPDSAGTIDFQNSINLNNGNRTIIAQNGSAAVDGIVSGVISNGWLIKDGEGTLALLGTNTYNRTTTINAGTLQIGNGSDAGSIDSISGIVNNGSLVYKVGSGNRTLGVVVSGSGSLVQDSVGGTLTIGSVNTYTGDTVVSAGTILLSGTGQLGSGNLTISGGTANLGGKSITTTLGPLTSGTLTNGTLTNNGSSFDIRSGTVSAILDGNNTLLKTTTGNVTLSAANTYTGGSALNGGILVLGNATALGSSGTISFGGGTLQYGSGITTDLSSRVSSGAGQAVVIDTYGNTVTFASALSSSGGTLVKTGAGTLVLGGANTYSGSTTVSAGTISLAGSGVFGSGGVSVSSGAAVHFDHTSDFTVSNNFSGAGALVQSGALAVILSGSNTNTGTVSATSGILKFSGAEALSSSLTELSASNATISLTDGTARTLTLDTGDLSMADGALAFDIGTTSDRLTLSSGSATLSGTNTVKLNFLSEIASPATWTLLSAADGLNGTWVLDEVFTGVAQSGFTFNLSSNATALTLSAVASSSTITWTGSTSGLWNVGTNWSGGSVPGGGSDVVFSSSSLDNLGTSLGGDTTIKTLTIQRDGVSIAGGNTLTINSTSALAVSVSADSGTVTINASLAGAGAGLNKSGNGTLILGGANSYGGGTTLQAGTLQIHSDASLGADSGNLTVSPGSGNTATLQMAADGATLHANRTISVSSGTLGIDTQSNNLTIASVMSGAGQLEKTGAGSLTLSGANSRTGTTTISQGTLAVSGGGAISDSGTVILANAAGVVFSIAASETIGSLQGGGASGGQTSIASSQTLTVAQSGSATYSGTLTGAGAFVLNGSGSLGLTGNNSFSGGVGLNSGTLAMNHANALGSAGTISFGGGTLQYGTGISTDLSSRLSTAGGQAFVIDTNGNDVTYATALAGAGSTLSKSGAGTLVLAGDNSFSGAVTLSAGTLQIGNGGSTGALAAASISNSGHLAFDSTGTHTLSGAITGTGSFSKAGSGNLTLAAGNDYTGATSILAGRLATSVANSLADSTTVAISSGALFQLGGSETIASFSGAGDISIGNYTLTTGGDNANTTLSGAILGTSGSLVKSGIGTLTLGGNNTYTGTTTINGGTLRLDSTGNLASSGTVRIAQNARFEISSNLTIAMAYEAGASNGGTISLGEGAFLTITSNTAATFYQNSIVGAGGLIKDGASTYRLYGTNTYTGGTTLNNGTLFLQGATAGDIVINGGTLQMGSNVISNSASVTLNGGTMSVLGAVDTVGTVILNGGTLTSTTGGLAAANGFVFNSGTLAGTLAAGNVTVASGTTRIDGNNRLASNSTLTISSGQLTLNGTQTINKLVMNGGTLDGAFTINATGGFEISAGTITANLGGDGAITKNDAGTLTLGGTGSYSGGIVLNAGTISLVSASGLGTGALTQANGGSLLLIDTTGTVSNALSVYNVQASQTVTLGGAITVNNATFDVEDGETLTLSNSINGTGGVTKNGTGTLVLSGSNTYSGATVVNAGVLEAANANALGANASVTVNGGSLLVSTDDALNGKNLALASAASGNGTAASLVFSGTYNGAAGSLTLNENSIIDLGTGSVVVHFTDLVMGVASTLAIYNWTGTTLWGGGDGNNTDQFYIDRTLTGSELGRISFYSGIDNSSFVGTAFQLSGGSFANEVIPVPEPETYVTALLLAGLSLLGNVWGRKFFRKKLDI